VEALESETTPDHASLGAGLNLQIGATKNLDYFGSCLIARLSYHQSPCPTLAAGTHM
jgi:hypothetical protein